MTSELSKAYDNPQQGFKMSAGIQCSAKRLGHLISNFHVCHNVTNLDKAIVSVAQNLFNKAVVLVLRISFTALTPVLKEKQRDVKRRDLSSLAEMEDGYNSKE